MTKTLVLSILALALLQRSIVNAQWVQVNGISHRGANALGVNGSSIFAGSTVWTGGVFFSSDNGTNWQEADSGLKNEFGVTPSIETFAFNDTNVFAGTDAGSISLY